MSESNDNEYKFTDPSNVTFEPFMENKWMNVNDVDSDHLEMQELIKESIFSLKEFLYSQLSLEKQIFVKLLKQAKGIVFLKTTKGSLGVGASIGTGLVLIRNESEFYKWIGPIAIASVGLQVGFNIGIQKTYNIFILQDSKAIQTFLSKGHLRLGCDMSMAIGTIGRDCNFSISLNHQGVLSSMISYSMAKGAYAGWSFEGQIITLRNDCNEEYYKQKINLQMILNGALLSPNNDDFNQLCMLLDKYVKRHDDEILADIDANSWTINRETKRVQI